MAWNPLLPFQMLGQDIENAATWLQNLGPSPAQVGEFVVGPIAERAPDIPGFIGQVVTGGQPQGASGKTDWSTVQKDLVLIGGLLAVVLIVKG